MCTERPPSPAGSRRSDDRVARTIDRVGALCRAGIPAPRAWRIAARRDPDLEDVAGGGSILDGLTEAGLRDPGGPWADVAALWSVAERTGAPAAPTLTATAAAIREGAATRRAITVALAGPTASGRVVLALPLLGVLLGGLVGANSLGVLFGTPIGWCCTAVGAALVVVARNWTARLVRAASPDPRLPGALAEAWAVALSGGGSWLDAEHAVDHAFRTRGSSVSERDHLRETLELAREAGVPAAGLLRALAEDLRRETASEGLMAAERLAVRLVLPLGVCLLPAFVVVGIVPVVVGILSSTVVGSP